MNIIEAVKSGKPFRHHTWGENQWASMESDRMVATSVESLIMDDWEIKEDLKDQAPDLTVTFEEFKLKENPKKYEIHPGVWAEDIKFETYSNKEEVLAYAYESPMYNFSNGAKVIIFTDKSLPEEDTDFRKSPDGWFKRRPELDIKKQKHTSWIE